MIFISAGLFNLVLFVRLSPSVMVVVRFYSDEVVNGRALQRAAKLCPQLSVSTELCYNVELTGERPTACHVIIMLIVQVRFFKHFAVSYTKSTLPCRCFLLLSAAGTESLSAEQKEVLLWLFRPPLQAEQLLEKPKLTESPGNKVVEIGPRYRWNSLRSLIYNLLCHSMWLYICPKVSWMLSSYLVFKDEIFVDQVKENSKKVFSDRIQSQFSFVFLFSWLSSPDSLVCSCLILSMNTGIAQWSSCDRALSVLCHGNNYFYL